MCSVLAGHSTMRRPKTINKHWNKLAFIRIDKIIIRTSECHCNLRVKLLWQPWWVSWLLATSCQAWPQIQAQLKFKPIGARADTKFGFRPPHHPPHRKLFFSVKTILYWTYHNETWQEAIYYDSNKYYIAYQHIGHSLTDSLIDWLTDSQLAPNVKIQLNEHP